MAPWTGKLIQSNLDKLTADNIEATAVKLVSLLETRSQVQKLALLVSQRVQRAYNPTFHLPFDEKRRHIADSLVSCLLQSYAKYSRPIKGVPTKEGLSGIALLKADLLSAGLFEKTRIGPVATSLYNSTALSCEDVTKILLACLDKTYANDVDKVTDALLLLEYTARQLDREDRTSMDGIMVLVKQALDEVPDRASERKTCGERIIPSLYDRYWDLVEKRKEGWNESPYGTAVNPSTLTYPIIDEKGREEAKPSSSSSGFNDDTPATFTSLADQADQAERALWLADFAPVDDDSKQASRKGSDAKVEGPETFVFPTKKEKPQKQQQQLPTSVSSTSLSSKVAPVRPPRSRCPSCARETVPPVMDDYALVAYGQAMGDPDLVSKQQSYQQAKYASTSDTIAGDGLNPPVSFDNEDDSMWFHLTLQAGSPIKIKFDADTRLGDARRMARLLAASIADGEVKGNNSSLSPPIHFLPNGRVGQTLQTPSSNGEAKNIFIQYPHDMTLLQARQVGDCLAGAVDSSRA